MSPSTAQTGKRQPEQTPNGHARRQIRSRAKKPPGPWKPSPRAHGADRPVRRFLGDRRTGPVTCALGQHATMQSKRELACTSPRSIELDVTAPFRTACLGDPMPTTVARTGQLHSQQERPALQLCHAGWHRRVDEGDGQAVASPAAPPFEGNSPGGGPGVTVHLHCNRLSSNAAGGIQPQFGEP